MFALRFKCYGVKKVFSKTQYFLPKFDQTVLRCIGNINYSMIKFAFILKGLASEGALKGAKMGGNFRNL